MAIQSKDRSRTTTIHDIPDDLLELTLLRIPSTAGVIRAAATCKLWRRVIGDAGFIRRFRRRKGPLIVGHYYRSCIYMPSFVPLIPAPAGEIAVGDISDRVSLGFLPSSYTKQNPVLHDSRGGLLAFSSFGSWIFVCNPWTRKKALFSYPMTPPATREEGKLETQSILGAFLLDVDDPTAMLDLELNFRILCVQLRHCRDDGSKTVQAAVYSARDDHRWLQLGTMAVGDIAVGTLVFVGRAGGSICWSTGITNVLHLDEGTGEFSCFTLPGPGINRNSGWFYSDMQSLRVIGGSSGSVHLLRIDIDDLELLCHDRSSGVCVVGRRIRAWQVVGQYPRWCFADDITADAAAAPGRIVLCDVKCRVEYVWMFSIVTHNIELVCVQKLTRRGAQAFPYELPWTIRACL